MQPTARDVSVTAVGLVIGVRVMINKKGKRWGLVTLDDKSARIEVRFFNQDFEAFVELLEKDRILVVSGQVSFDDFSGGLTMTGRDVMDIMTAREKYVTGVNVSIDQSQIDDSFVERFHAILSPYKNGTCPLNVFYRSAQAQAKLTLGVEWRVSPVDELLHELKPLVKDVELKFN